MFQRELGVQKALAASKMELGEFMKEMVCCERCWGLESLPCRPPLCSLLDRRCRELAWWKIGCHHYEEQPSVGICMQLPPLAKKRIYWHFCPCGLAGCIVCF